MNIYAPFKKKISLASSYYKNFIYIFIYSCFPSSSLYFFFYNANYKYCNIHILSLYSALHS